MKRVYGLIWSDNEHKFGEPIPISRHEIEHYKFPDAIIYAKNKVQASKAIKRFNEEYKETAREEIASIFETTP